MKGTIVSVNLKSFDKRFICPQCHQEKTPDNKIIYCDSCNVMTTNNCCLSKMQIELVVQDSGTKELLDLKSSFDVFKNGFSKAMQNSKDKITLAKIILKKKIEVQYIEKDMTVLEVLPIEN